MAAEHMRFIAYFVEMLVSGYFLYDRNIREAVLKCQMYADGVIKEPSCRNSSVIHICNLGQRCLQMHNYTNATRSILILTEANRDLLDTGIKGILQSVRGS